MSLRSHLTLGRPEFEIPTARHGRRRPTPPEPLPGSIWAVVTLVAWAMSALTTLLSVALFGAARNGLWLLAVVMFAVGAVALARGWERL